MLDLPALPGAYVLEFILSQQAEITVGRPGQASFPAGALFYLGSARGPGGLKARLGCHLQPVKLATPHWHIDSLRAVARVRALAYLIQPAAMPVAPLECLWSQALAQLPGSCLPLPGFGASDCRKGCPAHLVAFPGEQKSNHPLLASSGWLQSLALVAGAPLTIVPSPG